MKPQALFILFLLIGCQKPKSEPQITSVKPVTNKTETSSTKESFLKTDTISISDDGQIKDNYVLAHLLDQKADQDSIVTAKYRLDFYQNKTQMASSKITIKGVQKGSEWGASCGLTLESSKNSPFLQISFGYPACGYVQNNYLYYLKNNDLQLVHQWDSMSDSGWGNWVEFKNPTAKANPESFYCKTVAFEPDDSNNNDNEDVGIVSYSDSIVFRLSGNHWKKQLLSVKDKAYFEKKMAFNEFHDIK